MQVKSRIGVMMMYYYIDYVPFYWSSKELEGGARTDEQNYFLASSPSHFRKTGGKTEDDLKVTLSTTCLRAQALRHTLSRLYKSVLFCTSFLKSYCLTSETMK
jgi:hypothetical protein